MLNTAGILLIRVREIQLSFSKKNPVKVIPENEKNESSWLQPCNSGVISSEQKLLR